MFCTLVIYYTFLSIIITWVAFLCKVIYHYHYHHFGMRLPWKYLYPLGADLNWNIPPDHQQPHDDVIRWKHFPRYWPFVREIHRLPVNPPHKGQWVLMFSLIWAWTNDWVNIRKVIWDAVWFIMTSLWYVVLTVQDKHWNRNVFTLTETWHFHQWLHWKLSKWQLPMHPLMKISSKWRTFQCLIPYEYVTMVTGVLDAGIPL